MTAKDANNVLMAMAMTTANNTTTTTTSHLKAAPTNTLPLKLTFSPWKQASKPGMAKTAGTTANTNQLLPKDP